MDIRAISIIVGATILFFICSSVLYRFAGGNILRLISWSYRILFIFLILNIIDTTFKTYEAAQLFVVKEYIFVIVEIFFLLILTLLKMLIIWKGARIGKESQKLMIIITISIVVLPLLNLGYFAKRLDIF